MLHRHAYRLIWWDFPQLRFPSAPVSLICIKLTAKTNYDRGNLYYPLWDPRNPAENGAGKDLRARRFGGVWNAIFWAIHNDCKSQNSYGCPHWICTRMDLSTLKLGLKRVSGAPTYPSLLNYLLIVQDPGRWGVVAFCCVPTDNQ